MNRYKRLAALLLTGAALVAFTGCKTTVVERVPAEPAPQPHDDRRPPPPPPDHHDDHRDDHHDDHR